jgi:hypothetical protein
MDHIRWVPCHHGMARTHVAMEEKACRYGGVIVNILNKQSRTADKGWSSSIEVGLGSNNSSP